MSKNIKEYVVENVIAYIDPDKELTTKIRNLPENSLVKKFLQECDFERFETFIKYKKYGLNFLDDYYCSNCDQEWRYGIDACNDLYWFDESSLEADEDRFFEENFEKVLPCGCKCTIY